jgi:hypothetical protein
MDASRSWRLMVLAALMAVLIGCTPTFNWREVAFEQADVKALLPCKPDRGSRAVTLAGQSVRMGMLGCESGGAMFTVSLVQASSVTQTPAVAAELQATSKATHSRQLSHGTYVAQVAIYGQPKEGRDGPSALSAQAVETFLSSLQMAGAK